MERIVILTILVALLVIHYFVVHKIAFLGFYYLPVLLAGYFCGKRTALLLSIFTIFLIVLYSVVEPGKMSPKIVGKHEDLAKLPPGSREGSDILDEIGKERFKLHFSLAAWGSFLVLSAIASSVLYEQKQRKLDELHHAYVGVVEILTKYLELANRQSAGRSVKVAELATAVARRMNLEEEATENTRIAALLHDLGHKKVSALILEKSAELGKKSGTTIRTRSITGQEILRSVTSVLEGVAPIVDAYHKHFVGGEEKVISEPVTMEAEIIAVARAYYDMVTGAPMRKPKAPGDALKEIRASAGREFSPEIIEAFEKVLQDGEVEIEPSKPPQEN